jgi:DNA-binding response OmpR family regulator
VAALLCILESDPLTLRLMGEVLETEGFATLRLSAADGALAVIKEKRPDVLVLDTTLETEHAGWTLLETLRSDNDIHETPVLLCTSDVNGVQKRAELLAKPPETSVLIKPFDPQALVTTIRAMLAPDAGTGEG